MSFKTWIDTGHLNSDSGAVSGGQVEVKRNDALADEVEKLCKWQGWSVGKTNENDPHTSLDERVNDAIKFGANIFVSIHHDWKLGEQAVIYSNSNNTLEIKSRRLAGYINRRMNDPKDSIPNGGIYADRRGLRVLKNKMPAVIVEASRVQDKYVIEKMARMIVQGICDYKGVAFRNKPQSPTTKPKVDPPRLKMGNNGVWVERLQRALNARGYHLVVDGDFGGATLRAVKSFQKKVGFEGLGVVGTLTWDKLGY